MTLLSSQQVVFNISIYEGAYIVPYEGHPDFPSKLYPLKRLYESLNKLPAKDVIVMLDSCFSGAKGRSITREGARPIAISIENPVLLARTR